MSGWRTQIAHLDVLDWTAILVFAISIAGAIYGWILRHP